MPRYLREFVPVAPDLAEEAKAAATNQPTRGFRPVTSSIAQHHPCAVNCPLLRRTYC